MGSEEGWGIPWYVFLFFSSSRSFPFLFEVYYDILFYVIHCIGDLSSCVII